MKCPCATIPKSLSAICTARTPKVHVIEVSDLKGKDFSDTSDPIVYASCLGMTKHTSVKQGVTSAVFDEVLHFNFTNLSR